MKSKILTEKDEFRNSVERIRFRERRIQPHGVAVPSCISTEMGHLDYETTVPVGLDENTDDCAKYSLQCSCRIAVMVPTTHFELMGRQKKLLTKRWKDPKPVALEYKCGQESHNENEPCRAK